MATATTSLTVNALPTAGLTNNGPLSCAMTSVTLTASGGTSYTFTNSSGTVLGTSGPTTTRTVMASGTYSVRVANASGCVSSTSTTVTSNTAGTPARLYVRASASGANTGLSWQDAFPHLQSALNYGCRSNLTEIWIAGALTSPARAETPRPASRCCPMWPSTGAL